MYDLVSSIAVSNIHKSYKHYLVCLFIFKESLASSGLNWFSINSAEQANLAHIIESAIKKSRSFLETLLVSRHRP